MNGDFQPGPILGSHIRPLPVEERKKNQRLEN